MDTAGLIFGAGLVGGASFLVVLGALLSEQPKMKAQLHSASRLSVFPFFAAIAGLLYVFVVIGSVASARMGNFAPVYFATHIGQSSALMQVIATTLYLFGAIVVAPSWAAAGRLIDLSQLTGRWRWMIFAICLLFATFVLALSFNVLKDGVCLC